MKQRLIIPSMIITMIMINSLTAHATEPQEMGKHTIQLLKSIESWDNKTYEEFMISIEDIYQSLHKGKDTSPEINDKAKEGWLNEMDKRFARVREDGAELGIKWQKIKYIDFDYKSKMEGKVNIYDGHLHFSYKKKHYIIEVGFLMTDKGLRLGNLEDLREETDE